MQCTPKTIHYWHNPHSSEIGGNYIEFIKILEGPTCITVDGEDRNRQRAIVTLLHGNEPSGLKAVFNFLMAESIPKTNLSIFIVAVNAALLEPIFSHRYLPDEEDQNRCFGFFDAPLHTLSNQQLLAGNIVSELKNLKPEAVIDTHNTSAHSDAFAVACRIDKRTEQLTDIFTKKLVVLEQRLGTLMEQDINCPIITIEFGGFLDPRADSLAQESIGNFIRQDDLFIKSTVDLQILRKPYRLELKKNTILHYSASVQNHADITIFNTIDQLNFEPLAAGTSIGWLGTDGLEALTVTSKDGENICMNFFEETNGFIATKVPLTLFMATTDAHIAGNDCLMYLCPHEYRAQ